MQPSRFVTLDPDRPLHVLTATARGMIEGNFIRAAQRAYSELMSAVFAAGVHDQVRSAVAFLPDRPVGPNDARCRYVAGVIFGFDLARQAGIPARPQVPLTGSMAWWPVPPGRYAVFEHRGPYEGLARLWFAIHDEWLPASRESLRQDAPPLELNIRTPDQAPPEDLLTEVWLPLA